MLVEVRRSWASRVITGREQCGSSLLLGGCVYIEYCRSYTELLKPISQAHWAAFMRTMPIRLIGEITWNGLGFVKGWVFVVFRHIMIQNGSACAIHGPYARYSPDASTWASPQL